MPVLTVMKVRQAAVALVGEDEAQGHGVLLVAAVHDPSHAFGVVPKLRLVQPDLKALEAPDEPVILF